MSDKAFAESDIDLCQSPTDAKSARIRLSRECSWPEISHEKNASHESPALHWSPFLDYTDSSGHYFGCVGCEKCDSTETNVHNETAESTGGSDGDLNGCGDLRYLHDLDDFDDHCMYEPMHAMYAGFCCGESSLGNNCSGCEHLFDDLFEWHLCPDIYRWNR